MLLDALCEISLSFSNIAFVAVIAGDGIDSGAGGIGGVGSIYACVGVGEILDCLGLDCCVTFILRAVSLL